MLLGHGHQALHLVKGPCMKHRTSGGQGTFCAAGGIRCQLDGPSQEGGSRSHPPPRLCTTSRMLELKRYLFVRFGGSRRVVPGPCDLDLGLDRSSRRGRHEPADGRWATPLGRRPIVRVDGESEPRSRNRRRPWPLLPRLKLTRSRVGAQRPREGRHHQTGSAAAIYKQAPAVLGQRLDAAEEALLDLGCYGDQSGR